MRSVSSDTLHQIFVGTVVLVAILVSCLLIPAHLFAAPFSDYFQFSQPDGTVLTLKGQGDEFHADFETEDGYTVVFDSDKNAYFYAQLSKDGKHLVSNNVLAHQPSHQSMTRHLRADNKTVRETARLRRKQWEDETGITERWMQLKTQALGSEGAMVASASELFSPPSSPTVGEKVGLTLLIDFSDAPATVSKESIEEFLNGDGYSGNENNGSVKEYFRDVSNGLLTYTNVVTVYIRMQQPKSYYNDTSKDSGTQGQLLIKDAFAILKARADYNGLILPTFNSLTVNSSNRVVALNVLFAGSSSGVWAKGLWPSSSSVSSIPLGNGMSVSRYQITNIGAAPTIGTISHENGHMLCGFPDLYDYGSDSKGGAGYFSLMGYGNNLNSGKNPSQVDAYLKLAAGWGTAIDITASSRFSAALTAAPNIGYNTFYRFRKPGVATEYFLIENRQTKGRDAHLPGAGIAVWHVDQLGDKDNQSLAPNTTHQNYELTLVQADNLWHFEKNSIGYGDSFDLFYSGNGAAAYTNRFDDTSSPNGNWWDGTQSHIKLNSFSSNGMTMTFTIGDPISVPAAPVITSVLAGNSLAAVYFSPPSYDGGSVINGYSVYSSSGEVVFSDSIPVVVFGLVNGNSYNFTVKAVNAAGQSPASTMSVNVTPGVAMLSGDDATGYQSLQSAYDAAIEGTTIKVLDDARFGEFAVTSTNSKGNVNIVGGYDDAFIQAGGLPARVGRITLSAGTTRFDNVVVHSP